MANDYKVLYRKYRPITFDEIVGQKFSVEMLKNAVSSDKISHAYIFTGPRGTGKTSTAKIFAKTINCENLKDGIPCGECNSCKNINNNADIIEIDAASNNGVDEIRELINNVKIAPSFSKYKVYIIDEVHMLSQSAFNALLLTLEEPPSHIVFILATTNIENVPITILSRCQRYDFKKLSDDELINHLKKIAAKENISISEDAIREIAYLSEGGCRDALSILNQLSTSNNNIELETVLNNYGSVSLIQIKNIVKYYIADDYDKLKELFDNISKSSIDYKTFLKKLIDQLFIEALNAKVSHNDNKYLNIRETIFELNDLINKININIDPFVLIFLVLVKNVEIPNDSLKEKAQQDDVSQETINSPKNIIEEKELEVQEKNIEIENENIDLVETDEYYNYLQQLKEVRLNNCFAEADKSLLLDSKERWLNFNNSLNLTDSIKSIVIDSEVVLASSKLNIVIDTQESIVDMFNKELINIEKKYFEITNVKMHFISLSSKDWEKSKKEYIKKIKEKYVYQVMDEPIWKDKQEDVILDDEHEDYLNVLDIFDKEKIEIQ